MADNHASLGHRPNATQTLVLTLRDAEGREWVAGATITTLRPVVAPADTTERKQLTEGDGMKVSAIKVVIP